jgi:hypothetical protein
VKEERPRGQRRGVEPLSLMPNEGAESLLLFQPLDRAQGLEDGEVSTAGGDWKLLIPTSTDGGSSERRTIQGCLLSASHVTASWDTSPGANM